MKRTILVAALFTLTFSACKKDDNNGTPACELTEATFVGTYKVTSVKYKIDALGSSEIDGTGFVLEPCEIDDNTTFSSNHNYAKSDLGTHCVPDGSETGTWSLSGNVLTTDGVLTDTLSNVTCNGSAITGFTIIEHGAIQDGDKVTINIQKL